MVFFVAYTRSLQQANMVPATAFTDGHLITISVGKWEIVNDTIFDLYGTDWMAQRIGISSFDVANHSISTFVGTIAAFNYTYLYIPIFNALCGYLFGRSLDNSKSASRWCYLGRVEPLGSRDFGEWSI